MSSCSSSVSAPFSTRRDASRTARRRRCSSSPGSSRNSCAAPDPPRERTEYGPRMEKTATGLEFEDTQVGTGPSPQKGQTCVMHYTGWLWVNGAKGSKFDSSVDRGSPFEFKIGIGQVIKGWDEGVASMKVGGKR